MNNTHVQFFSVITGKFGIQLETLEYIACQLGIFIRMSVLESMFRAGKTTPRIFN